jgi:TonB family protein
MTALTAHHRLYTLAWDGDPESSRRFRRILRPLLALLAILGIVLPLLPMPQPSPLETRVPQRLAQIMLHTERKPRPVPPAKVAPLERAAVRPQAMAHPQPRDRLAHERAERSIEAVKDQLAALRQQMNFAPLETRNLTGAVKAAAHAERSLLTARAGEGSGGITSAHFSRGFGRGAGSLHGHDVTTVTSSILRGGVDARHPQAGGGGGAARSAEEIAMVFDRNKGAIYALYERALRSNPLLQGKLVLQFTISPGGAVTRCRVVSSDLHDPELERAIVARVLLFQFRPEKVDPTTATKPIDFFPA